MPASMFGPGAMQASDGSHLDDLAPAGEAVAMLERVIVAPSTGVFRPYDTPQDIDLDEGDVVGVLETRGAAVAVRSPFPGRMMGVLARPGERVHRGQAVAWLRSGC